MQALPLVLFGVLGIIWGSNFIYMKWASEYISVLQIVLLRVVFGFIPVFLYALIRKEFRLKHLKHIGHFWVMSLIATIIYYYGFAQGAALLFSGVAGALSGAIPLFSFALALLLLPEEKSTVHRFLGITIGFLGIFLISKPFANTESSANIMGVLYMIVGSLSVGASFIYAKKYIIPLKIPSAALTSYQLGLAILLLLCFTETDGIGAIFTSTHTAIGVVLGLGILGTGLAFIIYYYLIQKLGAISASSVTYLPPVVALIIGTTWAGEKIIWLDYLGTACILIGVVLANRKKRKPRKPAE